MVLAIITWSKQVQFDGYFLDCMHNKNEYKAFFSKQLSVHDIKNIIIVNISC